MPSFFLSFFLLLLPHHSILTHAQETCQSSTIDIVLCLDGSGSMGSHYPEVQTFANLFVDKFTLSPTDTQIAVLRFESSVTDGTNGFSSTKSTINAAINVPLPGGTTNTHKCIDQGKALFASSGRAGAAQLLVILTDGRPSDQNAAASSADSAIAAGIVLLGVGANVGSYGRDSVLAMTSNQCKGQNTVGCSDGLKNPPQCVTPCDDHYVDATTFADLPNIIDAVVDVACVDPGCQYTMGPWSECDAQDPPMRWQEPVINFAPSPTIPAGQPGACPGRNTEKCGQIECAAKADFLLLLDASGSMSSCDWKAQGWFGNEFVSRLPSAAGTFEHAQVGIVQFSSDVNIDQILTTSRVDALNVLDCDRCSPGTGVCNYQMQTGGTSTMIAMLQAISELSKSPARADANKVIILMTDGGPNGMESLPAALSSWCQSQGLRLNNREDMVVCVSKYGTMLLYNVGCCCTMWMNGLFLLDRVLVPLSKKSWQCVLIEQTFVFVFFSFLFKYH